MSQLRTKRSRSQASGVVPGRVPKKVAQALRDLEDPDLLGEVAAVGPGFYRSPAVGTQLGAALAEYRTARGLTQQQLAKELLLFQSQVARLEAGQHTPELETLIRVARHLRLTLTLTITPEGASLAVAHDRIGRVAVDQAADSAAG